VHIRAALRVIYLPDLTRSQLVAGAVNRGRGRRLRGDPRPLFDHAATHAGAVELPGERGVARVHVRFDQQVIGRVVAELEIDNWGEHRRIHARPLARLVVADAIGVFSPLKDRKTRVERGLESGRAHLAHAAAHTGDRLVADDDQPLLVTGL